MSIEDAVRNDDRYLMDLLLEQDDNIYVALYTAIDENNLPMVRYLVGRGANPNTDEQHAIYVALHNSNQEDTQILEYLIPMLDDLEYSIDYASNIPNYPALRVLSRYTNDIDYILHRLSYFAPLDIIQEFLSYGGSYPDLVAAIYGRNLPLIDYLLSIEVDIHRPNDEGEYPINVAMELGYADIVQDLLNYDSKMLSTDIGR